MIGLMNEIFITHKGYIKDTFGGRRYVIIDWADATAIKLVMPDDLSITGYGPFQQMNIDAFKEYLEVDLDNLSEWYEVDRKNAIAFLHSYPAHIF